VYDLFLNLRCLVLLLKEESTTDVVPEASQKLGLKRTSCGILLDGNAKENFLAVWNPKTSTLTIRDANKVCVGECDRGRRGGGYLKLHPIFQFFLPENRLS